MQGTGLLGFQGATANSLDGVSGEIGMLGSTGMQRPEEEHYQWQAAGLYQFLPFSVARQPTSTLARTSES
jgi:hypothetical protein